MPPDRVLDIMGREVGAAIDPDCFAALKDVLQVQGRAPEHDTPAATLVPALAEDYGQAA
jgi:hypothetical protein